jgi:hypothetical protein
MDGVIPLASKAIRLLLLLEGAAFVIAGLTHFGVLMHGYEHRQAGTAESVIGIVLLIGFVLSWLLPKSTRGIGIAVQAFALLGDLCWNLHDRHWRRPAHIPGYRLTRCYRNCADIWPYRDLSGTEAGWS